MGVSIKSAEAERKLRRVSRLLGKSMTATVIELADSKLKELDAKKDRERRLRKVDEIVRRVSALPVLDDRSATKIFAKKKEWLFDLASAPTPPLVLFTLTKRKRHLSLLGSSRSTFHASALRTFWKLR